MLPVVIANPAQHILRLRRQWVLPSAVYHLANACPIGLTERGQRIPKLDVKAAHLCQRRSSLGGRQSTSHGKSHGFCVCGRARRQVLEICGDDRMEKREIAGEHRVDVDRKAS